MPSNEIRPRFRSKPKPEISCLLVGRNVSERDTQNYLMNYLREKTIEKNNNI